jgi:hypothetical protein
MNNIQNELIENGYCVIENVLNEDEIKYAKDCFYDWLNHDKQIKDLHTKISPHCIFKHMQIGHQRHAWYIRTRPKVQEVFKNIWKTDELVVSYDGTCYVNSDTIKRDNVWIHTDQAPITKGLQCYQGFVSLTDNINRTWVCYEGSHKLHEEYAKEKNLTSKKNWLLIDNEYLEKIKEKKKIIHVKAGSLVLWDSRIFHQNQYGGDCKEERLIQYVSYLPRKDLKEKIREKRMKYFLSRRTTSHWPYPVKVNGKQPQTYGNKSLEVNYKTLNEPYLDDMIENIMKLI